MQGEAERDVGKGDEVGRLQARVAALEEAGAFHRTLIEASDDLIFVIDREGRVRYVNPVAARLIGAPPEALEGRRRADLFPPDIAERQQASLRRVFETGEAVDVDSWIAYPQGRIWANSRLIPVRDAEGHVEFVVGFSRDISRRKAAEDALAQSEQKFRDLAEGIPDGAALLEQGKLHWVNPALSAMYGYCDGELVGQPVEVTVAPEARDVAMQRHRDRVAGKDVPTRYESLAMRKDGSKFVVDVHARMVTSDGRPMVQAILRDITDQKQAKDALALSELQHRSVLDSLADGVHVVDRDLRLLLYNRTLIEWLRAQSVPFDPQGRNLFELFPFLPSIVRDEYHQVFESGKTLLTEETTRVNGREIITETRKIPVLEGGMVVRVITVVRDLTAQRRLEREFLREQKLESIGLLAGGIAHDFNNLLTGILANLAVARQQAGPEGELPHVLDEAHRAAERARTLTQRLLTFSGGGAPICAPVALAPLVGEAIELALASSLVGCDVRLPDGLWQANADAGQIAQVLQNLLLNARQAMPRGGRVEIAAENCAVGPDSPLPIAPGNYVSLAVKDRGMGIPPEHLGKLFTPYFSTRQDGRGLGLAAAHSIVRRHGGCIAVQSALGVGSTFTVYLPAADVVATAPPPPASRPAPAAGRRVLVMDDDEIIRRAARRLLQARGYDVELAADGAEAVEVFALAQAAVRPFDAVVLDLIVPGGMGGEECLQRLRRLDPEVRAVLCSGYSVEPTLAEFRELGFRGVLRKPFTVDDLCQAIESAVACKAP